ncbi:MAG: PIG-L family deacetylase [Candidatus Limivicinus sp.]|jgi:LmbE family N-acetylglucosaminyl deacetylase
MEQKKKRFSAGCVFAALVIAAEVFFVLDMVFTRSSSNLSPAAALIIFSVSLIAAVVLSIFKPAAVKRTALVLTILLLLTAAVLWGIWASFSKNGVYRETDDGKGSIYGGKKVLAMVPHEDDEVNILGGVLEQYVKYGSQVYVAYLTNGDMQVPAERRFAEAVKAMEKCGIPEENLIFLGYGDSMNQDGLDIYFCPPDAVITSHAGFTATYGTESHPSFRTGNSYTLEHMYEDIRDVILRLHPDVIYCSDYDVHGDHRALSLLFDRAMGEILRNGTGYRPHVYKAFAYSTAYEAEQDFYADNIKSTKNPSPYEYMTENNVYSWPERLRLPVNAETLSRSIMSSSTYDALKSYDSQYSAKMADGIISGDRVFWNRETGSLCYDAEMFASSGDAELTRDFVLSDRKRPDSPITPVENTWVPDADDEMKKLSVKFTEETKICRIRLYDNPSLEDNVLNARILFDDGSEIQSGPLPENGSALELKFDPRTVKSVEVQLTETEGSFAGLTEFEIYDTPADYGFKFIKLMNLEDDFVYDYYIDPQGEERFRLYGWGCSNNVSNYRLFVTGDEDCSARVEGPELVVNCPRGKSCTVTVGNRDASISDTVYFRNDRSVFLNFCQSLEKYMRKEFREGMTGSCTWKIGRDIYHAFR